MSESSPLTAFWIWQRQSSYTPYHQAILAQKTFRLGRAASGSLKIAVDGGYRLFVNGEWVADGPARSWPEHFQYDVIDVSPYLQVGRNELAVIARHWQVGDFHTRPQQAGLLVQLDLSLRRNRRIVSDASWQTAWLPAWSSNTPKVSIQMEPQELYDARLSEALEYSDAAVLYPANRGPWQDLHPRDVALLARRPRALRRFVGANLVKRRGDLNFCLPAARLAHPDAVEANHFYSAAGGMATWLELAAPAEIQLALEGMRASVDGMVNPEGRYTLEPGRHFVLAFAWPVYGHRKERNLRIVEPPAGMRLYNPLAAEYANPWVYVSLPAFQLAEDDMTWMWFKGPHGKRDGLAQAYEEAMDGLLSAGPRALEAGAAPRLLPADEMFVTDTHWLFTNREVIGSAAEFVQDATALMHDNPTLTTVRPSANGDIELVYDLGEETIGYFDFELLAPAGVSVDWYAVEYIAPDGTIQHSGDNHNGLRYITHPGLNRFTSLKRRAGRYFFITLRCPGAGCATEEERIPPSPVQIRLARVIESTYPAEHRAAFDCSDASLGRIWQISARTLELCMEDTFTDCPLYEQTYWVGDARNESIFAYDAFGATDIALRCLRLAAQSLERYPLVGGQVPSSWDMLLPAWSFLWGIAVWDYYFYTGERAALEELWPAVVRNLEGAEKQLDGSGLFSGPFWNMFDWSGIDDQHETVLHNSLLLVGAVDAAQKSAAVLGDAPHSAWLAGLRERLTAAINRCWDPARGAYPDSILENGKPSPSTCQHTSFLALLYDVIPAQARGAALSKTLTPPDGMVRVGSPFAIMYLYEALAKIGKPEAILQSIYDNYLPMLQSGASTVWEVFPSSKDRPGGFPTRSHCHAWSSAPLHFLGQIVLGIQQTAPGGAAYILSPWLGDLTWASGSICTARGMIEVRWQRSGSQVEVFLRAPKGVEIHCEKNDSMEGLEVTWWSE